MGLLRQYFNNNKGLFVMTISLFVIGIILGTVVACRLGETTVTQLAEQLDGYISGDNIAKIGFGSIFANRCEDNLRYILAVLILTRSRWLLPVATMLPAVCGYRLGFAVSFVCGSFGGDGVAMSVVSMVVYYLLTMPLYILTFVLAVTYSPGIANSRRKGDTVLLISALAVIYGLLCLGALAEGVLVPFAVGIVLG